MKAKVDSPEAARRSGRKQMLKSLIKQRIDAAEMFRKGGRDEQAEKEEAEKTLIESYLPAGGQRGRDRGRDRRSPGRNRRHVIKQMGAGDESGAGETAGKDR